MRRYRIVGLIASAAVLILCWVIFARFSDTSAPLRFSRFEPCCGFGEADEVAATKAFLREFPIGTPLANIVDFFAKAGGRCYSFPERPDDLICTYAHRTCPFAPIFNTWSAVIKFDKTSNTSVEVKLTAGVEGP